MKVLIIGNSGSGKSTRARALTIKHGLFHLDLDSIVWDPRAAVQRSAEAISAALNAFIQSSPRRVIEGCYSELVRRAAGYCDELVFANPGVAACLSNDVR